MRSTIATLLFFYNILEIIGQSTCPASGVICNSSTQYQMCTILEGQVVLIGTSTSCPVGYVCDSSSTFICQPSSATTNPLPTTTGPPATVTASPATTAPPPTTALPSTITASPATTTPSATTAPPAIPTTTAPPATVTASPATAAPPPTTTTTIKPPCNQTSVSPGPQCNQYYSCVEVMWWFSNELVTCPTGQAFNETAGQCTDSTTCIV